MEGLLAVVSRALKRGPSGPVILEDTIDEFIFKLAFCPGSLGCLLLNL